VGDLQALAWRKGLLVYSLQPLSAVVDELNRDFPGKIMVAIRAFANASSAALSI